MSCFPDRVGWAVPRHRHRLEREKWKSLFRSIQQHNTLEMNACLFLLLLLLLFCVVAVVFATSFGSRPCSLFVCLFRPLAKTLLLGAARDMGWVNPVLKSGIFVLFCLCCCFVPFVVCVVCVVFWLCCSLSLCSCLRCCCCYDPSCPPQHNSHTHGWSDLRRDQMDTPQNISTFFFIGGLDGTWRSNFKKWSCHRLTNLLHHVCIHLRDQYQSKATSQQTKGTRTKGVSGDETTEHQHLLLFRWVDQHLTQQVQDNEHALD